jgi:hypothetical protein
MVLGDFPSSKKLVLNKTIFSTVKSTSSALGIYLSKNIDICCIAVLYVLLVLGAIAASSSRFAVLIK